FTLVKVSLCIAGFIPEGLRNILCWPVELSTSTPNAHGTGTQPSPDLKAHARPAYAVRVLHRPLLRAKTKTNQA
ncbi:MAG TPA: hypothetical protein VJN01_10200, partial [Xanthomonadales bacterium]|nr:hypothetical protein [Xanthomonadales bacterium]